MTIQVIRATIINRLPGRSFYQMTARHKPFDRGGENVVTSPVHGGRSRCAGSSLHRSSLCHRRNGPRAPRCHEHARQRPLLRRLRHGGDEDARDQRRSKLAGPGQDPRRLLQAWGIGVPSLAPTLPAFLREDLRQPVRQSQFCASLLELVEEFRPLSGALLRPAPAQRRALERSGTVQRRRLGSDRYGPAPRPRQDPWPAGRPHQRRVLHPQHDQRHQGPADDRPVSTGPRGSTSQQRSRRRRRPQDSQPEGR